MSHRQPKRVSLAPDEILRAARKFLGVPFRHQGRTRDGLDCVGYLYVVGRELGFDSKIVHDYGYGYYPGMTTIVKELLLHCEQVSKRTLRPGDIMVMHVNSVHPQHTAFKTDRGMIHATASPPSMVVEHGMDEEWYSRIRKVFRIREAC